MIHPNLENTWALVENVIHPVITSVKKNLQEIQLTFSSRTVRILGGGIFPNENLQTKLATFKCTQWTQVNGF